MEQTNSLLLTMTILLPQKIHLKMQAQALNRMPPADTTGRCALPAARIKAAPGVFCAKRYNTRTMAEERSLPP